MARPRDLSATNRTRLVVTLAVLLGIAGIYVYNRSPQPEPSPAAPTPAPPAARVPVAAVPEAGVVVAPPRPLSAPRTPPGADAAAPASPAPHPESVVRGAWGAAPGEFGRASAHESNPEVPMAVCPVAPGEVAVLDQANRRVQRFRDGRLVGTLALHGEGAQDLAALPGGRIAVLDRLGDPSVQVFDANGRAVGTLPLVGGTLTEGGSVTGIFADATGIYAEREHQGLVRLADAAGQADPDRAEIWGRPSRDGVLLLRAAITDRAAGEVTVRATDRARGTPAWGRAVQFDAPVLHVALLDSDRRGNVYVGADTGREAAEAPYGIVGEKITVVRLGAGGAPTGSLDLPPLPAADETFRPLGVDDDGAVYELVPGETGLDVVRHAFPG